MVHDGEIGAVQLSVRVRSISAPVTRRLRIAEQATLAQLHAVLQVAFGWSDTHLYTFLIRGGQFSDRARGMELAIAGGADIPLAAFGFEISEPFCYRYNLFVPWEIDCRVKGRCLISREQWVACMGAQGYPPDEDLRGPAAYSQWLAETSPTHALCELEDLMAEEDLDATRFREAASSILSQARGGEPTRRAIDQRLRQLPNYAWSAGDLYENEGPVGH
jgi:hypothetical protein